jgi:hypothetical protein
VGTTQMGFSPDRTDNPSHAPIHSSVSLLPSIAILRTSTGYHSIVNRFVLSMHVEAKFKIIKSAFARSRNYNFASEKRKPQFFLWRYQRLDDIMPRWGIRV